MDGENEAEINKNILTMTRECDEWSIKGRAGNVRAILFFLGSMAGLFLRIWPLYWAGLVLQIANVIHGKIYIIRPWRKAVNRLGHEVAKLTGTPWRPEDLP